MPCYMEGGGDQAKPVKVVVLFCYDIEKGFSFLKSKIPAFNEPERTLSFDLA